MSKLQIHQFMCRSDNFGLLIHDPDTGLTASIDTPDGDEILAQLRRKDWQLSHIFNTHHHHDHVPGNMFLKQQYGCTIVGAKCDANRIPGIDVELSDGETFPFGAHPFQLLETPGHTLGSVCYYLPEDAILFTGDTLFSMGCGRLFEGTAEMMWASLQRIMALPDETLIYCGHEYTLTNAEFALEVDPDNEAVQKRADEVKALRSAKKPTLPVKLGVERTTNPFLRPDQTGVQQHFGMADSPAIEVFAATRALRNSF